jgi:uncharacterized protein YuzE
LVGDYSNRKILLVTGGRHEAFDPKYYVAYIRFQEKLGQVTTIKISDDMNIDIAPDGTVYGVELLNANEQLTRDHGALIVESGGQRQEITLVA